jgi:hypothetical protein
MSDPITISDGSGADLLSREVRTADKEAEASPVGKQTPWPIGLHSIEERRKKEEEGSKRGEEEEKKRRAAAAAAGRAA